MMNIMCYLGKLAYYIQMFSIMARSLFFVWFNFSGEAFIAVFGVGKKKYLERYLRLRRYNTANSKQLYTHIRSVMDTKTPPGKDCSSGFSIIDCDYKCFFKKPLFVVRCRCSHCGNIFSFAELSDFVPYMEDIASFACPCCAAALIWRSKEVRSRLWDIFEKVKFPHLSQSPHLSQDTQREPSRVQHTLMLAQSLLPLAKIRFGSCYPNAGHLVMDVARLYNGKKHRLYEPSLDFYTYDHGAYTNRYITYLWDRVFLHTNFDEDMRVVLSPRVVDYTRRLPYSSPNYVQYHGFEISHPDIFSLPWKFIAEERILAKKKLIDMGIPAGAKIACLLGRDEAYMKSFNAPATYIMQYRNSDINTYKNAAEYLVSQGWYVLRMGFVTGKAIEWENERIIDYANRYRDPFLDVYIFYHCNLCITTGTGLDIIPQLRHIPTVFVNYFYAQHCNPAYGPSVLISKHFILRGRELSFEEYVSDKYALAEKARILISPNAVPPLEKEGIQIIDNSPEEILDAVKECLEMMEGRDTSTEEDRENQRFAWFTPANAVRSYRHPLARYGRAWLRNVPLRAPDQL